MADRGGFLREGAITYAYILLYIALSSCQIFFNKEINFPYPLGLTLLHMVFSSALCFILTKVLKIMKVEEGMTVDIHITSLIPIGAMFAITLWLGNTAYLYMSVAFARMLNAIRTTGLAIWAVTLLGILAGGAPLVYNTRRLLRGTNLIGRRSQRISVAEIIWGFSFVILSYLIPSMNLLG